MTRNIFGWLKTWFHVTIFILALKDFLFSCSLYEVTTADCSIWLNWHKFYPGCPSWHSWDSNPDLPHSGTALPLTHQGGLSATTTTSASEKKTQLHPTKCPTKLNFTYPVKIQNGARQQVKLAFALQKHSGWLHIQYPNCVIRICVQKVCNKSKYCTFRDMEPFRVWSANDPCSLQNSAVWRFRFQEPRNCLVWTSDIWINANRSENQNKWQINDYNITRDNCRKDVFSSFIMFTGSATFLLSPMRHLSHEDYVTCLYGVNP